MTGREQQYGFRVRNSHDDIHHNTRTKEKNQIHPSQRNQGTLVLFCKTKQCRNALLYLAETTVSIHLQTYKLPTTYNPGNVVILGSQYVKFPIPLPSKRTQCTIEVSLGHGVVEDLIHVRIRYMSVDKLHRVYGKDRTQDGDASQQNGHLHKRMVGRNTNQRERTLWLCSMSIL